MKIKRAGDKEQEKKVAALIPSNGGWVGETIDFVKVHNFKSNKKGYIQR